MFLGLGLIGLTLGILAPATGSMGSSLAAHPLAASALGWTNVTANSPRSPGPLEGSAMAYDAADQEFVLYGGVNPVQDSYSASTWTYKGGQWSQLNLNPSPLPSDFASMAYDPAIPGVVYWGGGGPLGFYNDTWVFSHGSWTEICSPCQEGPVARWGMSMAYDSSSDEIVAYGGCSSVPTNLSSGHCPWNDTWVLGIQGSTPTWRELVTNPQPLECFGAALVDDPTLGGVVLYGGYDNDRTGPGLSPILSGTWLFKSDAWIRLVPGTVPDPLYFAAYANDVAAGGPLLFGGLTPSTGIGTQVTASTYLYAQGNWAMVNSTPAPPARASAAFAYDNSTGTFLLYGGVGSNSPYTDTWMFGNVTSPSTSAHSRDTLFGIPIVSLVILAILAIAIVLVLLHLLRSRTGNSAPAVRRETGVSAPEVPGVVSGGTDRRNGEPLRLKIKLSPLTVVETHDPADVWAALQDETLEPSRMLIVTKTPHDVPAMLAKGELWHMAYGEGEGRVLPGDLDRLGSIIETHLTKTPGCVVYVDALDLVSHATSFKSARRLVQVTREMAEEHSAHALFRIPPGFYTPTELSQLEEGAQVIRL